MKTTKNIVLVIFLGIFIFSEGCKKDKDDDPKPTSPTNPIAPISYSKFKINEVIVSSMPFLNGSGNNWDTFSNPDIYFLISDQSGNLLFDGSSAYKPNVSPSNIPTGWAFSPPYIVQPLSNGFYIHLYDNDVNDFPSDADDYIGSALFTMSNYTSTYPTTITNYLGGTYITIKGTWSN